LKTKYFPYHHLLAALLCFAIAAALNLYGYFAQPNASKTEKVIAQNVDTAIRKAVRDLNRVKPYLAQDTINFHDLLNNKTYYPTFIFKNGRAVFWTDHTLEVDFLDDTFHPGPVVVENKFGKFLISGAVYGPYRIQVYVPLVRQYGITNKYLEPGLNKDIFGLHRVQIVLDPGSLATAIKYRGRYLFSIVFSGPEGTQSVSNAAIALISLGIFFLIWGLIRISRVMVRGGKLLNATLLLTLPLLAIRLVLLYFNFPFSVLELDAFDPKLYAASFWSPSIGDLVLNAMLLLVLTLHLNQMFRRKKVAAFLQRQGPQTRFLIGVACAVGFYLLVLGLHFIYYSSFSNSRLVMDITQSLQFSGYKTLLFSAFIIHTIVFLVLAHLLIQVFLYVHEEQHPLFWYLGLAAVGVILVFSGALLDKVPVILLGLSFLFYLAIFFSRFKKNISANPFQNYLFIFWIIGISAMTGSLAVYEHYLHKLVEDKQKFAADLLLDRDIQGELILNDLARQIQDDKIIRTQVVNPLTNRGFIQQKILKYYLPDYFDRYETSVKIFAGTDSSAQLVGTNYSFGEYQHNNLAEATDTEQPGLYLARKGVEPFSRKYLKVFQITGLDSSRVTVAMELNLKKVMPYSVVPELLQDQEYFQPIYGRAFSFAIFDQDYRLLHPEGDFEYGHDFNRKSFQDPNLYTTGLRMARYHHLAVKGSGGKLLAVVSTRQYSVLDVISNFSFLFLLHTFVFLVYMVAYLLFGTGIQQALNTNFSTKIQFFLNFGILIPLLVVSVAIASLVTASYKKDLQGTYEQRGKMVQKHILSSWSWDDYHTNKEALQEEIMNIADLAEADINLYDSAGLLITSSQPLIFEAGLLSRFMNPEAYADIRENSAPRIQLKEQTGDISFNAIYIPLPSLFDASQVDGFIGIPFFDSEKELESKLIQLLTTIMNIFTAMFIAFIVITNWASRALTVPLKLVTDKLKQTTLTGQNEKLEYQSADEIGLLVNEYNLMLEKLEESKKELATREKEAAWREMARQVAHEIKNPLTPMKLSLQYLQKAIAEKRDNMEALISKISQTLITQIEILSDIATSFSNFTALPELKPERLNITQVLRQSLDLHTNPAEVQITTDIPEGTFEVIADENILMRSFNNLILNALQAIPAGREPRLKVAMKPNHHLVLISFRDNGAGIPAEIHHKIFVPNFSTKFTGSGIGLAVVKKGIESSGGRIWFDTQEGQGTTFYIELPLAHE
jgi:two-component system nitrogen regulation sensor histidine kinase NtrY